METEGLFAPDSRAEARTHYETLAPASREVVRSVAKEMEFDNEEYDDRVTGEVIDTARKALFSSLLEVYVGTRKEYQSWCADNDSEEIVVGSDEVDNVVWHAAPFAETVVAATFQHEREAAIGTLRRQAFGRIYSEVLE